MSDRSKNHATCAEAGLRATLKFLLPLLFIADTTAKASSGYRSPKRNDGEQ
jgi:hypothetical protein